MTPRSIAIPLACALLAACGNNGESSDPGGVTPGEKRALDDAAEIIEQRQLPPSAIPSPPPASQPAAER